MGAIVETWKSPLWRVRQNLVSRCGARYKILRLAAREGSISNKRGKKEEGGGEVNKNKNQKLETRN